MSSHPEILSVYDACREAHINIPTFPQNISGLDTTSGIGENARVTLDDVEYARNVVSAIRGHFGEHRRASGHRDGTNICV